MEQINIDELAKQLAGGLSLDELRRKQAGRISSGGIPDIPSLVPQTQAASEYLQRLKTSTSKKNVDVSRKFVHEMDYTEAKRKVWALFQERAAQIEQITSKPFSWEIKEPEILANMVKYFINDPACVWPIAKGLFVYGNPGTGKSEFMGIFSRFTNENELSKAFKTTSMSEVYVSAKSDKDFDPVSTNVQFDRAFDEFCRHYGSVKRFGDDIDINEAIIEARYSRSQRYGQITHFITNGTPNTIKEQLSPMVFDRIRSMCTSVQFKGESKRS